MRVSKGVGYCERGECEDRLKGIFLLNHSDKFRCPRCHMGEGFIETERYTDTGEDDDPETCVYKTVKVHFSFDPTTRKHKEIAVVEISGKVVNGREYAIYSPMIRTGKQAMKVAEVTLCAINSGFKGGVLDEIIVNLDSPEWRKQLEQVEILLESRERRLVGALR